MQRCQEKAVQVEGRVSAKSLRQEKGWDKPSKGACAMR